MKSPPLTVIDRLIWLGFMVLAGVWAACMLAGCKTGTPQKPVPEQLSGNSGQLPPLPQGVQMLATGRSVALVAVQPPPAAVVLSWDGGTNTGDFWIEVCTNAITPGGWWTLQTVPNTGAASYSVTTGAGVAFWRVNQLPAGVHFP